MDEHKKFENRVVVITGASGGLGSVVSRQFARSGAKLVLVGQHIEKLDLLGNSLEIPRQQWISVAADLTQEKAAAEVLKAVITNFGHIDILIHLVGGWIGGKSLSQVSSEELDEMMKQHIWSTFNVTHALVPKLIENKWGRLIIVSSPSVANPPANGLPYSIAKSGQEALMLTLAEELKGTGVTANILRVRAIDVNNEKVLNPSVKNAHWTTPAEIDAAMEYLCSEEAGTVNGARIPLYGGA